jgi:hypothetical protein
MPKHFTPTARPAESRQRHHSRSGGTGRLWRKDRASSSLLGSVGRPMRSELVANWSWCGAGGRRMPQFNAHPTALRGACHDRRKGEINRVPILAGWLLNPAARQPSGGRRSLLAGGRLAGSRTSGDARTKPIRTTGH